MKENKNKYNVYYHYNPKNGKYYIGITMQEPIKRWGYNGGHYKSNQHFWRAIQRDGWDNFEHVVIETGLSREMAVSMEKRLIKECDSYNNGYNNSYGGESMDGYEMAQSIKDKRRKAVLKYDLQGNFIRRYDSISVATNAENIKHIGSCCSGKRKTAGGYIWKYAE